MRTSSVRTTGVTAVLMMAAFVPLALVPTCATAEDVTVQSASPLGNKEPGKSETAIGDLAADALRREMRTELSFVTASELKPKDPPIPAGKVTSSEVAALVSYSDDPLAVIQITGKAVRQALERSVSIYPQSNMAFLQVSGLRFSFDSSRPSGSRVTSVTVGNSDLIDSATYSVAVTNSMANGALGYFKVWTDEQVKERNPNTNIARAIESYFRANPKIDYGSLDRVTVAK